MALLSIVIDHKNWYSKHNNLTHFGWNLLQYAQFWVTILRSLIL